MSNKKTETGSENRRSHRAYKDPTADMAIANIMREERRKKRLKQQEHQEQRNTHSSFRGGVCHAGK